MSECLGRMLNRSGKWEGRKRKECDRIGSNQRGEDPNEALTRAGSPAMHNLHQLRTRPD